MKVEECKVHATNFKEVSCDIWTSSCSFIEAKKAYLNSLTVRDMLEMFINGKAIAWRNLLTIETFINCETADEIEEKLELANTREKKMVDVVWTPVKKSLVNNP